MFGDHRERGLGRSRRRGLGLLLRPPRRGEQEKRDDDLCETVFVRERHRVQDTWPFGSGQPVTKPLRSEEHTPELQSPYDLVCRLPPEKKKTERPSCGTIITFIPRIKAKDNNPPTWLDGKITTKMAPILSSTTTRSRNRTSNLRRLNAD